MSETLFTKIINREIPAEIVYEDDDCLCFQDVNPKAPVHYLLVPKKHIRRLIDAETDDRVLLGHLMLKAGEIAAEEIDDGALANELELADVPDVDLLIRTGGERRISNFLLWSLAYAELWFCDTLWPDFGEQQFDEALQFFAQRQRRYGHTGDQVEAVNS